ncbi:hypothetical protein Lal_00028143 [Lupinus albus]|nr:hypothetical protein Lal_00028143 [Lupinus albus]
MCRWMKLLDDLLLVSDLLEVGLVEDDFCTEVGFGECDFYREVGLGRGDFYREVGLGRGDYLEKSVWRCVTSLEKSVWRDFRYIYKTTLQRLWMEEEMNLNHEIPKAVDEIDVSEDENINEVEEFDFE